MTRRLPLRAGFLEQPDNFVEAFELRADHRRSSNSACLVGPGRIGPLAQQELHELHVLVLNRQVKGRRAVAVDVHIDVRTPLDEGLDDVRKERHKPPR